MNDRSGCDDSRICEELRGERDGVGFHETYRGDPPSRVVGRSRNFTLLVDLAPLVEGHLLLVPNDHLLSFGHVPVNQWDELERFRDASVSSVRKEYDDVVLLEHGSSSDLLYSACVNHAHWHIVPVQVPMLEFFARDGLQGRPIASARDLMEPAARDQPYIYYYDPQSQEHHVFERNLSKRGQYLRMVVAEFIGLPDPDWDWAVDQRKDLLRATVSRIAGGVEP